MKKINKKRPGMVHLKIKIVCLTESKTILKVKIIAYSKTRPEATHLQSQPTVVDDGKAKQKSATTVKATRVPKSKTIRAQKRRSSTTKGTKELDSEQQKCKVR